jgi:hypothetical protein
VRGAIERSWQEWEALQFGNLRLADMSHMSVTSVKSELEKRFDCDFGTDSSGSEFGRYVAREMGVEGYK